MALTDMSSGFKDNPTRALIAEAIRAGKRQVPLNINPAFSNLGAVLIGGEPGSIEVGFTADETTTQGNGVVGGGTLANMLDCSMAVAVLSSLPPGQTCTTISITVNMQKAANVGEFRAKAKIERLGRRIAFASASLLDEYSNVIATSISSLAIL